MEGYWGLSMWVSGFERVNGLQDMMFERLTYGIIYYYYYITHTYTHIHILLYIILIYIYIIIHILILYTILFFQYSPFPSSVLSPLSHLLFYSPHLSYLQSPSSNLYSSFLFFLPNIHSIRVGVSCWILISPRGLCSTLILHQQF